MSTSGDARGPLLALLLLVMAGHESEHVVQLLQKDALGEHCPDHCRGLLGFVFDVEWIHFVYNASIFLLLAGLFVAYRLWERRWRGERPLAWASLAAGIGMQGYHVVEHAAKLEQWLTNGHHAPTPGLLGKLLPWHGITLVELHFTLNTVVLACVLVGYFGLGFHRRVWGGWPALGRAALGMAAPVALVVVSVQALAAATAPPTVRLSPGVHPGPLVITRREKLVGQPGAVVRGGIVVRASDVTVRGVAVRGGENGIEVDDARGVVLDRVSVAGAALDGIHVRRSQVTIRGCAIASPPGYTQGIDISFAMDKGASTVEGCTVTGGREGIVTHSAMVTVRGNRVSATSLRGITMTEMSMGMIERNNVIGALGIGIFCGDRSECAIEHNRVSGTRVDRASGDRSRLGYAIESHFQARAELAGNTLHGNARGTSAFAGATMVRRE